MKNVRYWTKAILAYETMLHVWVHRIGGHVIKMPVGLREYYQNTLAEEMSTYIEPLQTYDLKDPFWMPEVVNNIFTTYYKIKVTNLVRSPSGIPSHFISSMSSINPALSQ